MDYSKHIAVYPGFPKPGISFKDISTLLANPEAFHSCIDDMVAICEKYQADVIIGAESRGFLFGAAIAYEMHKGFIMARKAGKLPGKTIKVEYALEYGTAALEIPVGLIKEGERVVLVDDLMATGGTFVALRDLVTKAGGVPVCALSLIQLEELHGQDAVGVPCEWLLTLSDSH